jgi:uncharacterized protein (DUF302 family)
MTPQNPTTTAATTDSNAYSFWVRLRNIDFPRAIEKTVAALKAEGFGVLTDIDVQAVMQSKLHISTGAYRILGACNPLLAHHAIKLEPNIGLLLPCNVVVREESNGTIIVAFMDPISVLQLASNPEISSVALNVHERLVRVGALVARSEIAHADRPTTATQV